MPQGVLRPAVVLVVVGVVGVVMVRPLCYSLAFLFSLTSSSTTERRPASNTLR